MTKGNEGTASRACLASTISGMSPTALGKLVFWFGDTTTDTKTLWKEIPSGAKDTRNELDLYLAVMVAMNACTTGSFVAKL